MPMFDYVCDWCGHVESDFIVARWDIGVGCPDCVNTMKRLPTAGVPHMFPTEGIFLENVSPDGKLFHSRNEMKKYEKSHDVEISMLH